MNELLRLFVGQAPPAPPRYDPVRIGAIRQQLTQRVQDLRAKSDHYHTLAVNGRNRRLAQRRMLGVSDSATKRERPAAHDMIVQHLAQSRLIDREADRVEQQLLTLDQQFEALQQHEASVLAIEALQAGNAALRAAQASLAVDQIERVNAEMEETLAAVQDVTDAATAQPAVSAAALLDPDEVEAFLLGGGDDWESSGEERAPSRDAAVVVPAPQHTPPRAPTETMDTDYEAVPLL